MIGPGLLLVFIIMDGTGMKLFCWMNFSGFISFKASFVFELLVLNSCSWPDRLPSSLDSFIGPLSVRECENS